MIVSPGKNLESGHMVVSAIAVNEMKVRLFVKPYCPWCHKAVAWLEARGVKYQTLDVIADKKSFDEMVKLSGQTFAPVIEVDGEILADFGPEELAKFWEKLPQT